MPPLRPVMSAPSTMFKTAEDQARYYAAYDATLAMWPVPEKSFDVPTRFGSTHVHACGPEDMPPLVLLPGQAISSTMWYPNIEALSGDHRVYAPDIVGDMGKSIQTRRFQQPSDFADWVCDMLDGLAVEAANIAGLSYGGFIALRTAIESPQRLRKLTLLAPASLLALRPRFFLRMAAMFVPGTSIESKGRLLLGMHSPNLSPAIKQMMTSHGFRSRMYLSPVATDDDLRRVNTPTLILLGNREVIYDYRRAISRASRLMAHLETTVVPGASHTVSLDQPELVNERILDLLRSATGVGRRHRLTELPGTPVP